MGVDNDGNSSRRPRRGLATNGVIAMVNAMLIGVGGVFLTTASVPATAVAASAVTVVILTLMVIRR